MRFRVILISGIGDVYKYLHEMRECPATNMSLSSLYIVTQY